VTDRGRTGSLHRSVRSGQRLPPSILTAVARRYSFLMESSRRGRQLLPQSARHVPASRWMHPLRSPLAVPRGRRQAGGGRKAILRAGAASATILFKDAREEVRFQEWTAGERVTVENDRGLEFFGPRGELRVGDEARRRPGSSASPAKSRWAPVQRRDRRAHSVR
jgi:hypothetical protein